MTVLTSHYKVQLGTNDSDWGTTMAATVKLMGVQDCSITPQIDQGIVPDLRGTLEPGYLAILNRISAEATIRGLATYNDLPYWFDALMGTATPTAASDEYLRAYVISSDCADTDAQPKIFTLQYGEASSDGNVFGMPGATLSSFRLSGNSGAPLEYTCGFFGKAMEADTFDALADRDVALIMGDHVALYIDPDTTAAGTTPITNTAFSFELNVNPNRAPVWHLGNLKPSGYRKGKWDATLNLTLELTPTVAAYMTSILAVTATPVKKVIRIKATDVTNTDVYAQFDFNGALLTAPRIFTDENGLATFQMTFQAIFGATLGGFLAGQIVNSVATMA